MAERRRLFWLLGLLAVVAVAYVYAGEVKLTTYYPAPYGEYMRVVARTLGVGDNNGDSKFDGSDAPDPATKSGEVWLKGNVGIGTRAPTSILALGGNSAQTFQMQRGTTADTAGYALTIKAGGATSGATNKAGGDLYLTSGISTGTGASNIYFQTVAAGTTGTTDNAPSTRMTVSGTGNVGIGTTTPSAKLDVNGGAVFTSEVNNAGTAINWTAGNKQAVTITGAVTLTFTNPTGATNLILRVVHGNTAGTITWSSVTPTISWKGGTAPVLSTTANTVDIIGFYFSGTTYYGAAMTDFK